MEPTRMCMVCRERRPKSELLRIARVRGGEAETDVGQTIQGRGMYICRSRECVSQARRRRVIERALGSCGADKVYDMLEREVGYDE